MTKRKFRYKSELDSFIYIYTKICTRFLWLSLYADNQWFLWKKVIQILQIQRHTNLAPMQTVIVNVFAYSGWWRARFVRTFFRPIYGEYTSRNCLNFCFTKKTHKKPKIKSIFAWPQTVVTNKCKRPNRHPIKRYKQFVEIIQKTKDIGCLKMSPCM